MPVWLRLSLVCLLGAVSIAALVGSAALYPERANDTQVGADRNGIADPTALAASASTRSVSSGEGLFVPDDIDEEPVHSLWRPGVRPLNVSLPAAGIDAPVIPGEVDEEARQMVAPDGPEDVAWYDFSALPGQGGNAVLAGHVDWAGHGPGVLWNLRDAVVGDIMRVELTDGTVLYYRVISNEVHHADEGPWGELFDPDPGRDMLTIYTCDGEFYAGTYDSRRVVQAVLTPPDRLW